VYTIGCGRPLLRATVPALQQRTSQLSFQEELIYPDLLWQFLFEDIDGAREHLPGHQLLVDTPHPL
jgi:hypothetical protein